MSGAHQHDRPHDHQPANLQLKIALAATALIAVIEVAGGFVAHSLALLSDAAHVSTDVCALGIALAAGIQATRPANERQTYGFARLEILAGLANSALLLGVTVLIVFEAIRRFMHPELPAGALMTIIAAIGLVVNVAVALMLLRGASDNLNMRAAMLHIGGDALGGLAVVLGGAAIVLTGAAWIDPALSLFVSAIILLGVVSVFRQATHVLLESVPDHTQLSLVRDAIRTTSGVVAVHDLHVWTIGSGHHALSAHVVIDDRRLSEANAVLKAIIQSMHEQFEIEHVTLQFECESCDDDEKIVCTQAPREPLSASGT